MGFLVLAALSSWTMPDGCRFLVSVCIAASASAMNTTSWPIGSWTFGRSELCLLIPTTLFHPVSAEAELRRPKTALEPWIISSGWIGTEATCPSMSSTSWLKPCGGFLIPMETVTPLAIWTNCAKAVDRVKAYQDFQPDEFNRRELNRRLRAFTQDREVRR